MWQKEITNTKKINCPTWCLYWQQESGTFLSEGDNCQVIGGGVSHTPSTDKADLK